MGSFNFQNSDAKTFSGLLMLPLGLLRLLKPCKVKRFLATEDLSVVGLVTGSSGNNGLKCGGSEKKKKKRGRETERGAMKMKTMEERGQISEGSHCRDKYNFLSTLFGPRRLTHFLSVCDDAAFIKHSPLCFGEDAEELTSEIVLASTFFSSCFFWFFCPLLRKGLEEGNTMH